MKKKNNNKSTAGGNGSDVRVLSLFSTLEEQSPDNPLEGGGQDQRPREATSQPVSRTAFLGPPDLTDGRDELNLIEFPLTLLSDRTPDGVNSLTYSDVVYDSGDGGKPVTRTLTITPAAGVGLPNACDGDVLLALIQLTRWGNGFTSRVVKFSRYELAKLLRWSTSGASYQRIEQSLNRWIGVTLYYNRAWWDKRQQCWVDEKFHILERVSLRTSHDGESEFTWGEVPFNSFRAENLKKIDLSMYFDLKLATSRRLFRFLDKRFYQRPQVSFDLRSLACEHVGLSRDYHNSQIKRKLMPAIRELEDIDYLEPADESERFVSPFPGSWRAFFAKKLTPLPKDSVAAELAARGVTPPVAAAVCAQFPIEHVQARIGVFDWLVESKDTRVARNPPGYLVDSIRKSYTPPADYPPIQAAAAAIAVVPVKPVGPTAEERLEEALKAAERERDGPVLAYLGALSQADYAVLEAEAIEGSESAKQFLLGVKSEMMRDGVKRRAVMARVRKILGLPD